MKTLKNTFSTKLIGVFTFSFILICTSIFSQGIYKSTEDYTENEIAIQEWMYNDELTNDNLFNEKFTEEPIELQDWMVSNELPTAMIAENYTEEEIPLQNWMVDTEPLMNSLGEYEEPLITIQEWMIDYNTFAPKANFNDLMSEIEESPIEINAWMKSYTIFKEKKLSPLYSIENNSLKALKPVFLASQDNK